MDPAIDFATRACLMLLFAAAAVHKLRDWARFRATVLDYRLLPSPLVVPASLAIVRPSSPWRRRRSRCHRRVPSGTPAATPASLCAIAISEPAPRTS
jgi:hypothetical protein